MMSARNLPVPDDYIVLEKKICPVCGRIHTHAAGIIIHTHFKSIPEDKQVTGWGMCEEHAKLHDDGFVALVAIDENQSTHEEGKPNSYHPNDVYRTGPIAHLKRDRFNIIFNVEAPESLLVFCEEDVITILREAEIER